MEISSSRVSVSGASMSTKKFWKTRTDSSTVPSCPAWLTAEPASFQVVMLSGSGTLRCALPSGSVMISGRQSAVSGKKQRAFQFER